MRISYFVKKYRNIYTDILKKDLQGIQDEGPNGDDIIVMAGGEGNYRKQTYS